MGRVMHAMRLLLTPAPPATPAPRYRRAGTPHLDIMSACRPGGFAPGDLPIGLQAIGPYLEDRTPIRFAALIAAEIGGFRRPAGYA